MNPQQAKNKRNRDTLSPQNPSDAKKTVLDIPVHPNRFELPSPTSPAPPSIGNPPPSPSILNTWDALKKLDSSLTKAKDGFRIIANNPEVKKNPLFPVIDSLFPLFDDLEKVLNSLSSDQSKNTSLIEKAVNTLKETEVTFENHQTSLATSAERQKLMSELKSSSLTTKVIKFPLPPNLKAEVDIFNAIEQKLRSLGNDPSLMIINPLKLKDLSDHIPINFICRDYLTKVRLDSSLRKDKIDTSYHWPSSLYKFVGDIRKQYKDVELENSPPPHERMVKIRPSRQCDKILVHFKSTLPSTPNTDPPKWILFESLALPLSKQTTRTSPNPCKSAFFNISPYIPNEYSF